MPDFERNTDDFAVKLAKESGHIEEAHALGFISGKNKARGEMAIIISILAIVISLISVFS